jgi:hypothetical protein
MSLDMYICSLAFARWEINRCTVLLQRQASLSTLQSKMAKQKAEMKKDLTSNGKKSKKAADAQAQADNKINIKLTELKSIEEDKKPPLPVQRIKVKEKDKKKAPPDANEIKIQVLLSVCF